MSEWVPKEELITPNIKFGVKNIELPPQRDYINVDCGKGNTYYRLQRFTMDFMREEFSNRSHYEMPPVQGNWDNVRTWVKNMWEAMYNPLWMRKYEEPHKRKWKYGVFDGHHRLRLFDALQADSIWAYVQNVKHFEKPNWVKNITAKNVRAPRKGTFSGACPNCGLESVKYKVLHRPNHRLLGGKLVCGKCGGKIEYPWAGVL
jgi:hypothetical protein